MKKKLLLLAFPCIAGISALHAQTVNDSINNTAERADALATEKARMSQNWKDSVQQGQAVTDREKATLNKDYNSVTKDYNENTRQAKEQMKDLDEVKTKENLETYKADRKQYRSDSAALAEQHAKYNKAVADGVSDQERAAMRKQYKKDKKQYKAQKRKVENQKKNLDSSNRPQ